MLVSAEMIKLAGVMVSNIFKIMFFLKSLLSIFLRSAVYLGQTLMGTPFQVPAWVRKFSFGSTGDEISSLIIIQNLFVQQKFEY